MNRQYQYMFITMGLLGFMFINMLGCFFSSEEETVITIWDHSLYVQADGFSIDNEPSLEELLTCEYELNTLEEFFGRHSAQGGMLKDLDMTKYHTWNEVNSMFPIQCLRYHKNTHYSVYRVKEGGFYYVIWMVPRKSDSLYLQEEELVIKTLFSVYIEELVSRESFNNIRKNVSTAKDILAIDPHMQLDFFASSGIYSYSLLDDGRVLEVKYSHNKLEVLDDLIVDDISVLQKDEVYAAIAFIAEEDLPNIGDD